MPAATALFTKGVLLGLGAAVPIGPVNVQIARLALRHGFAPAFALGCGAVTVDVAYAVFTSVGVEWLTRQPQVEWALRAGGILLLTYLGVMCLRGERMAWRADPVATAGGSAPGPAATRGAARAYATGLLMTLLNPMTLAFWFIAVPAIAGPMADPSSDGAAGNLPVLCSGVFAGTVAWVTFFAGVLAGAGKFRQNWWLAAADAAGGAALLVFAAAALLSSLQPFL